MSQIDLKGTIDVSHYENDTLSPIVSRRDRQAGRADKTERLPPVQLSNARPAEKSSSGWAIAGRVAVGILTGGVSELLRLAWRGIMACCSSSRPAPAPEPRTGAVGKALPAADPGADAQNAAIARAITGKGEMPAAHQAAVDELMAELRGKFGSKYLPEGKCVNDVVKTIAKDIDSNASRLVYTGVKDAKQAVSPEDLQNLIRRHLVPNLKKLVLADLAKAEAQKLGGLGGLGMTDLTLNQLLAPGLQKKLDACGNMEDVQAFFSKMGLGKTIGKINSALGDVVRELQGIYGKEALPDDLDGLLQLGNKGGHGTLKGALESLCYKGTVPITPEDVKEEARHYLLGSAHHRFVSKAVEQAALQQSCPVSARSVSALADAILAVPGNKDAINAAKDPKDLARIVNGMVSDLITVQKAAVEEVCAQYESQVRPELQPLLRAYVRGLSFAPADAAASRQAVHAMAGYMKDWKDFAGGGEDVQELENSYRQYFNDDLKHIEEGDRTDPTGFTDNIYNTCIRDSNGASYTFNGTRINPDNGKAEITGKIKELLPEGRDQRFLSKLINQRMGGNWTLLTSNGMLPDGQLAQDVAGTRFVPVKPGGNQLFLSGLPGVAATYDVQVADDKKTATVTSTLTHGMHYLDGKSFQGSIPAFGAVRYTFTFTLNLSAHPDGQGVAGFSVGQKFITVGDALAQSVKL